MYTYIVDCGNRRYKHSSYNTANKQYQLLKRKGFKPSKIKILDERTGLLITERR